MKKNATMLIALLMTMTIIISGCGKSGDVSSTSSQITSTQTSESEDKSADVIEITFADYGSSLMPTADAFRDTVEYVKEKSNGRIQINYVPDAVLGGAAESMQQLMDGTMQIAVIGSGEFSRFTDKIEPFQLPFLITDYDMEKYAFESAEGQALLDTLADIHLKIIGIAENGIRHFANNKRPINVPSDLNGLILRVVPSNMLTDSMELLGANPTPLAYGEIYTALQNKVIDGTEINITSLYAMKFYETIKYVSEIGMYPYPSTVTVNLDFWNSLSPEDQQIISDGFAYGEKNEFEKYLPEYEIKAKEACVEKGVKFNVIADTTPFKEAVVPVYEDYKSRDPKIKAFIELMENYQK